MIKLSHKTLIYISGFFWLLIGCFLLNLGLNLLMNPIQSNNTIPLTSSSYPLITLLSSYLGGSEYAIIAIITSGLFIGYFKGKYVLGKSARQGILRILKLPNPTSLTNIYNKKHYLLIALMMSLGFLFSFFKLNNDIRGFIDTTVGAALINGSLIYFRQRSTACDT